MYISSQGEPVAAPLRASGGARAQGCATRSPAGASPAGSRGQVSR